MSQSLVPTLILSGFLGTGKTTLLRELISKLEAAGRQPAVILNDHQNAKVDAASLAGEGRMVTPISGNCVCCDSMEELVKTMQGLPEHPGQILLVEANGTSDPASLLQHLLFKPDLRSRFYPILQVTCVHAARWQKRFWSNDLERLQVRTSSHLVLTHSDQASEARREHVIAQVEKWNPKGTWTNAEQLASELIHLPKARVVTYTAIPQNSSPHACQNGAREHQKHTMRGTASPTPEEHRLSHAYVAGQFQLPPVVSRARLLAWVTNLPPEILRVKGVAKFLEDPGTDYVFERTDDHKWGPTAFALKQPPTVPPCVVLIGVRIDSAAVQSSLTAL
ncbi:MAG: GTP-binding protein [Terrimicrobiaceae bacterium]